MDVNFIESNCEESSITVVIDSDLRDKKIYPSPNKYVVEFDQPIKDVFGFEILDAAVPVSLYSVEENNNSLALGMLFTTTTNVGDIYKDIENVLQTDTVFQEVFDAAENGNIFVVMGEAAASTITSMYPIQVEGTNVIFCIHNGKIIQKTFIEGDPNVSYSSSGNIVLTSSNGTSIDIEYLISMSYITIEAGNYDSLTMLKYLRSMNYFTNPVMATLSSETITTTWYDNASTTAQSLTQRYTWLLNSVYPFFFDMKKSTVSDIIGFSEINPTPPFKYKDNNYIFMSSVKEDEYGFQAISSPGVLVFQGTKYVTLRCPEIETHVLGSYSTLRQGLGLAIFKLTATNSIAFLRFDFQNMVRKKFHPIGKLSRLTFSFEDKHGNPYNFKGMNHFFLAEIKYYVPKKATQDFVPQINPQYIPDVLKYEMGQLKEKEHKKHALADVIREHNKYVR
jgi:hypothetical protein